MKESREARDEAVRRLLAEARHDEPMPADVVARLDGVLADLADEPARVRPVTDLATRRRRVSRLLLAAAAVVVVGVGVQQVLEPRAGDDASPTADREAQYDSADGGADLTGPEEDAAGSAESGAMSSQVAGVVLAELTSKDFPDDVAAARDRGALRSPKQDLTLAGALQSAFAATPEDCDAGSWGPGSFVPVSYDGLPAVLVLRPVMGQTQVADLFLCGQAEPLRSVTLPAP